MNPTHLRTFLAVRKHRNYTRAGEELFLSQPAVSRQIRQLEQDLGVQVFEQIGKTLHVTDAGETLAAEAEKLLGAMERAVEAVRAHRSAEHGRLRIGASTTPGLYLLPPYLGRLHERLPGLALHYVVENSRRIERMLVNNELDLGFVGARLENTDVQLEPLVIDEIICFAGPSHPLARRSAIPPQALQGETWIIREPGSATRKLFESWLTAHGGKIGRAIELKSPEAVKALVAAGVGFSFMSIHGLQADLAQQRLTRLPVTGLRLERPIYLARHASKHLSPAMRAFIEIVGMAASPSESAD